MPNLNIVATRAPLIFLDSGQSADESAFLELYRWRMHRDYQHNKPFYGRFWVIYPTSDYAHRYGWAGSLFGEDDWMNMHTRPRRLLNEEQPLRKKGLGTTREWVLRRGIARAMGRFEPNVKRFTPDAKPAWRRSLKDPTERATIAMLNPTERDFEYISQADHYWHRPDRIPRMVLAYDPDRPLTHGYQKWLWALLAWEESEYGMLKEELKGVNVLVRRLNWRMVLRKRRAEGRVHWSFPGSFGHSRRMRKPEMGKFMVEKMGSRLSSRIGTQNDTWQEVAAATNCEKYVILTHSEEGSVPFDARIALARGATLVAPDIPLYRRIETSRKVLYPCRSASHNAANWSPMDLASWFRSRFGISNG